jgi:hypothetical protein
MIFWLVLKLEINHRVIIFEGFWFLIEDILKIIFLHGQKFEFQKVFCCFKIFLKVNGNVLLWVCTRSMGILPQS